MLKQSEIDGILRLPGNAASVVVVVTTTTVTVLNRGHTGPLAPVEN